MHNRAGFTHDTCTILLTTSLFGCLDNIFGNDRTVRARNGTFLELAGNAFANQMSKSKANFHDLGGRSGRCDALVTVMREN